MTQQKLDGAAGSVPASSRWVAQLWRTKWGANFVLRMPALLAASEQMPLHGLVGDRLLLSREAFA